MPSRLLADLFITYLLDVECYTVQETGRPFRGDVRADANAYYSFRIRKNDTRITRARQILFVRSALSNEPSYNERRLRTNHPSSENTRVA